MNFKKEQKFEKAYAKELLRISKSDFVSAKVLADSTENLRVENIFLMAQQALEKALEALICHSEEPVPFTHDIEVLTDRLSQKVEVPFIGKFNSLSDFATLRLYIEGREEFSSDEIWEVLNELEVAISWVNQVINA